MVACHVYVIFQTKRNKYEKKLQVENKILDFFFQTP